MRGAGAWACIGLVAPAHLCSIAVRALGRKQSPTLDSGVIARGVGQVRGGPPVEIVETETFAAAASTRRRGPASGALCLRAHLAKATISLNRRSAPARKPLEAHPNAALRHRILLSPAACRTARRLAAKPGGRAAVRAVAASGVGKDCGERVVGYEEVVRRHIVPRAVAVGGEEVHPLEPPPFGHCVVALVTVGHHRKPFHQMAGTAKRGGVE